MALQYQIRRNKNGAVLQLVGRLVAGGGALQLRGLSHQLVNQNIEVDLTDVSSVDAAGLGGLVFLYNHVAAAGRQLTLVNVSDRIIKLLRLTGLSQFLVKPEAVAEPVPVGVGVMAAPVPAA